MNEEIVPRVFVLIGMLYLDQKKCEMKGEKFLRPKSGPAESVIKFTKNVDGFTFDELSKIFLLNWNYDIAYIFFYRCEEPF